MSKRELARDLGISDESARLILKKDLGLHPYKVQTVQELLPADYDKRSQFARIMMGRRMDDRNLERNLVFFDEAHFHLDGVPNRQNFRTWSATNPNFVVQEPLHSARVTVLMGVGYHGIIGPFFFDGNVTGDAYLEMLRENVLPALNLWPNANEIVLVQDGAPPHWKLTVRAFLNQNFAMRWIGRDSPFIVWPPRSPDLTPMDNSIWGHLKDKLYKGQKFSNLEVLRERIEEEAGLIPLDMCRRTLEDFWDRLLLCEHRGGMSIETTDD